MLKTGEFAMQPQAPAKNYLFFFVSVMALMLGWNTFKAWQWPPPPPKEKVWPVALEKAPKDQQAMMLARLGLAATGRGLADAVDLATQAGIGPVAGKAAAPPVVKEVVAPPKPAEPPQEVVFGGKGYAISATLTNQGAGVRELVLNHFAAVDKYGLRDDDQKQAVLERYGLPADDMKQQKPVVLIPRIANAPPAFAVFHYAKADDDDPQPLDTLGRVNWKIESQDVPAAGKQSITYSAEVPEFGVKLVKTFSLEPASYHLGLSIRVEKLAGAKADKKFRYQLAGAQGLPIEGEWYATTYRNTFVGLVDERDVLYRLTSDNATLNRTAGSDRYRKDNKRFAYAAVAVQYFASAIAVDNVDADGTKLPLDKLGFLQFARATVEGSPVPSKPFLDDITIRTISEPLDIAPGASVEHRFLLYHGPIKIRQLDRFGGDKAIARELIDRYADTLKLASLTDYGTFGFWTDAIILFTNLIHKLVGFLTTFLPSGLAIMVVTVCVRGMMFPISKRQAANMQRMQDKMAKLSPEIKELEKKYKDDFLLKQQAQRELYKKHNVNPAAGLSGCMMLFLQMPIFMGLYYALQESAFFRLEKFLWIRNLAAPDMLAWWGEAVPYLTHPDGQGTITYLGPYLNLLPVIAAVLIFVQQKMSMPAEMSEEQRQQYNIMKYMTGFMALMFYRVPAGLSLYFICSSLWGLAERKLVKKLIADQKIIDEAKPRTAKDSPKGKPKTIATPSRFQKWWEELLRNASKK